MSSSSSSLPLLPFAFFPLNTQPLSKVDSSPTYKNEPVRVTLVIENFCTETGHKSKTFRLPTNDRIIEFNLFCRPQSLDNLLEEKFTTIYLNLWRCYKREIIVRIQMSILNANGVKCQQQYRIKTFCIMEFGGLYHEKYDYFADPKNGFLVDGKLSICCEVEEIDPTSQKLLDNPISENYQSLLESGKFSDVTLNVKIGDKKLLVHKAILAAQSKVFAAMFENDCEEKRLNRVEIIDISAEVCEQMLSYIYTGKIPDLDKYSADLFVAVDKYQLDHLKCACERFLVTKIDVESAVYKLVLADMHHATLLKSKCIDFIVNNASKVIADEEWKTLANRADLMSDLFKSMTIKYESLYLDKLLDRR